MFRQWFCIIIGFSLSYMANGQFANYVSNGGLEKHYTCSNTSSSVAYVENAVDWLSVGKFNSGKYCHYCANTVPNNGFFRNYPRADSAYVLYDVFCLSCAQNNNRSYIRNRLKSNLIGGIAYCVKYYVNVGENSAYSIDKIGAYFGGDALDTIKKGQLPLTYLSPQIEPIPNSFPTDTIGWSLISGTFVATGVEKYMVIGNFRSDQATNTIISNTMTAAQQWSACEIALDDVSCIPLDLPAFAGHDTTCIPGTKVYLGRTRDVGIDEACTWYKLPLVITPTTAAIDTAAGIWVSPSETSTYVVRQEICGIVKFDTVIVYKDAVGLEDTETNDLYCIAPNPAQEILYLKGGKQGEKISVRITDLNGRILREEQVTVTGARTAIQLELINGVYFIHLLENNGKHTVKKVLVNK